ncbi:MAG: MFS transporter [Candidatus Omnitrophica bacterium]|nr:MFS transporter [Candidatus Omnitrophota bacterium]MDD5488161.1 MFS transporter [Candidatus Omnitrophota bacterium]
MTSLREVLFKRNFFPLWLGQIISEFGDRLNQMALISLVYAKSPGSVMALAKLIFFVVIPVFIIGPVAGVYVDRWDRKKVMIAADILRGTLVLFIPIFVLLDMMLPVYIMVFLIFSATRFFLPSKMAIIPDIVSEDKLLAANSLSNTTRMIATVLGFALAGYIVKWVGYMWGFYLDSLSYFVSAALIMLITPLSRNVREAATEEISIARDIIESSIKKNMWQEIADGIKCLFDNDKMKVVAASLFVSMAGIGSIFCIAIVFVQEVFGGGTKALGIMGVFVGTGLFAGTILYGKLGQKMSKIRSIFASFILTGLLLAAFALYAKTLSSMALAGCLIFLVGGAAAPIFICSNTLVHTLVPENIRGRIFSSMETLIHIAFLAFMFFTAILSKYVENFYILMASGIMFAMFGVFGMVMYSIKRDVTTG